MNIIERAGEIIANYVNRKAVDSVARVEMEMHGKGCGCKSCITGAVDEANSWIEFIAGESPEVAEHYKFKIVNVKGRLKIIDPRK